MQWHFSCQIGAKFVLRLEIGWWIWGSKFLCDTKLVLCGVLSYLEGFVWEVQKRHFDFSFPGRPLRQTS